MAKHTTSSPSKGTTAAGRRAALLALLGVGEDVPVRVWSECSVTISVSSDPPQFVKFSHGFEKMCPSSSTRAIKRTEAEIFAVCEEVVDRRVRKLKRLLRRLHA
jgi:hypothetical protein